jgi:hypothetical protein
MQANTSTVPYKIVPVQSAFLQTAQRQGLDDQAHVVERHIASGGEPCRDVFRRAAPGEAILLASYCPFQLASPYKEFGPVFVMADAATDTTPPDSLAALARNGYLGDQFVLRAYSAAERIVDGTVVTGEQAEATLQGMLRDENVRFVLVRFAGHGCYACRIERA